MRIAIATFAGVPIPPVKGGAVETLIGDLCSINETKNWLSIDLFSIYDLEAIKAAQSYKHTYFSYYKQYKNKKISYKNIVYKIFGKSIPDKTMSEIVRLINRNEYDFVIITSINKEMEYIFRQIHSKVIWYLHGDPLSVLDAYVVESIIHKCHAVFAVSDYVKNRVLSVAPDCNVITIKNCTDLVPMSDREQRIARQSVRKKMNIKEREILFAYIGRINKIKGLYELVCAFCKSNLPEAKLLVVGAPSNEEERRYFEKVRNAGNANVAYWGYAAHSSLCSLYYAADYIVVPSICQEAAPLVILEAKMCGRGIVATNIGGIPEYMDGKGLLVDYNDSFQENLSDAIKRAYAGLIASYKPESLSNQVEKFYDDFFYSLQSIS